MFLRLDDPQHFAIDSIEDRGIPGSIELPGEPLSAVPDLGEVVPAEGLGVRELGAPVRQMPVVTQLRPEGGSLENRLVEHFRGV